MDLRSIDTAPVSFKCSLYVVNAKGSFGAYEVMVFSPKQNPNHWDGEFDAYDAWFASQMPGKDPQATLDGLDGDGWNGWHGRAYVYPEYYHPTAWVGRHAVSFIESRAGNPQPWMAKVSFHRPHSPYDPPSRVLAKFAADELPPIYTSQGGSAAWDARFRGTASGSPV